MGGLTEPGGGDDEVLLAAEDRSCVEDDGEGPAGLARLRRG